MIKKILLVLALSSFATIAQAQTITTTVCPGAGCIDSTVANQGSVGIQITGTWVGTITFYGSVDGTNFTAISLTPAAGGTAVSTTTGNGVWLGNVAGLTTVRVAFTSFSSGSAGVSRRITQVKGAAGGTTGGGSGTVTSIATTSPITGGTITTTGTIACATCAVTSDTLAQFAATTSAQLAGVLSDELGSGKALFASDGSSGQVLTTNGSGSLSFADVIQSTTTIVNNIKFANGKGLTTDIHTNDTLPFQAYDTDDAVYRTFATLTAAATPNFDIASPTGGTLSFTLGSDATGDIYYRNSSGKVARLPIGSATNVLTVASGLPSWAAASSGGGALSAITAASAANTIASGNNHSQIWNWALTTNAINAFTFGETTAATSGASNAQAILGVNTLATSTADALYIKNLGGAAGIRVDDASSDTTSFYVDEDGEVGIHCASGGVTHSLEVCDGIINLDDASSGVNMTRMRLTNSTPEIGTVGALALQFTTDTGTTRGSIQPTTGQFVINGTATSTLGVSMLNIGVAGNIWTAGNYALIGFGYNGVGTATAPAYMGFTTTSGAGNTKGDLLFGTRADTSAVPTIRLRIDDQGTLVVPSTTPTPAVTNTSSNSCGTTAATIVGNNNVGEITIGATSGTSCTVTFTTTAPNEWICAVNDSTNGANEKAVPTSTTVSVFTGTFTAGDKVQYICFPR